jgi:two-component system, chemotaxis family, protein-glutamate methylesterase/glutaminase
LGMLLTGMGRDGAQGLLSMRNAGAMTVCQDEATSLIYGMPGAAMQIGAAVLELPLQEMSRIIMSTGVDRLSRKVVS